MRRLYTALAVVVATAGCGNLSSSAAGAGDSATQTGDSTAATGDGASADVAQPGHTSTLPPPYAAPDWAAQGWSPAKVLRLDGTVRRRGLREVRGLIHAHTAYSHDACDGKPFDKEGKINEPCIEDFRRDLCEVGHDFVFMTDHPTHFKDHPFPDVLHYHKDAGDALVERGGVMLANRMMCKDGHTAMLIPGTEGGMMPVGLDGHIADPTERAKVYGGDDLASREALIAAGAHVLAQHTEDWTAEQLGEKGWAGFEMYNLHANMMAHMNDAAKLFPILLNEDETMHPDLILAALVDEDPRYQETWAKVAEAGHRRVTTMGTDCHRNTFNIELNDGERVDSYRRMMIWFSNHLLIATEADGSYDDRHLEAALQARRLFGVFEVFGYAEGFDARIERDGKAPVEIGGEASLKDAPTIVADTPHVAMLPTDAEAPEIWTRILHAKGGAWVEVGKGDGRVSFKPTEAGGYRVETRIRPKHLRKHFGSLSAKADDDYAWVYANVFYVTE
ncbi:MAG: hypothetical protein H6747_04400 [Deltaproteobacteria bacterium]|nr:hypothetical protein [Deltaproteobacteria bacterium]